MKYLILVLLLLNPLYAADRSPYNENYYNQLWCMSINGHYEYRLDSGKRIDCLTDNFAIETDWANEKTYNGIGQSLVYAMETGRIPGLLLLIKDFNGLKWVELAKTTYKYHGLNAPVWYIYAHERME
jgi:hypothetical protein